MLTLPRIAAFLFCVSAAGGCMSTTDTITARAHMPLGDFAAQADDTKPNDTLKNGDDKKDKNKNGEKEKEGPKHIRDNAFLVEEAFNQETGDVQHIFNWINLWDRTPQGRTRDFAWTYTMELPLGSQAHQFSFVLQSLSGYEKPNDGPAVQQGDVGDTFLNYRYQLLDDDEFLWCAPRFSLILPTGDKRNGTGTGEVGYQFNLPISRYGEEFDYHFNAGMTHVPNVSTRLANGLDSRQQNLRAYNLGASAYWKPQVNLNFFVELLGLWNENFDDKGVRGRETQVFANPGFRYAVCQLDEVEWVIGASVPIGLTRDTPDIGVFIYMSVEHAFRKMDDAKE